MTEIRDFPQLSHPRSFVPARRALLLGLFTAAAAASWALCTTPGSGSRAVVSAAPRAVGTGLHISNPFALAGQFPQFPAGGNVSPDPQGFDLGDACFGSAVSRYISGLDGVVPYVCTSTTAGTVGLKVGNNGHVTGNLTFNGPGFANFSAILTDAAGAARSGLFFLNQNNCAGFHFVIDALPQASVGQDFNTQIEVTGGDATTTAFSVVPNSVKLNGGAVFDLETTGLRLFNDGFLSGRPLVAGTVTFTAQAIQNQNGVHALNRAQTAPDQVFTLNVLAAKSVETQMSTQTAGIVAGGFRDRYVLRAIVNTNGKDEFAFANKLFVLRLGKQTFSTTLDGFGQSRFGNLLVSLRGLKGQLSVALLNQDLTKIFDTLPADRSIQPIVQQISIGDDFLATEALAYGVRARRNSVALSFQLGRDLLLGGLFQITGVSARDFGNATAFRINFLISHVKGFTNTIFGTPQQAIVHIGPNFNETVNFFRGRGGRLPAPGVQSVSLNLKRKTGSITTFPLSATDTNVLPGSAGQRQTLLLGLNLTTDTVSFTGEASAILIPFTFGR